MTEVPAAALGLRRIEDLSWKQLLELDGCTKCGRCHEACPARSSGLPLSPRDLVLDLREHADSVHGARLPFDPRRGQPLDGGPRSGELAGGVIPAETLWACTTCLACVEVCPVGIEHVPMIVGMRRALVDDGAVDKRLQDVLAKIAQHGNSFGSAARTRGRWTGGLPFPVKDIRKEPAEYLWFVGDYASFDKRVQSATRATAAVLQRAGVDFGILYDAERNSGNDVRRLGEEGLFDLLVAENAAALAQAEYTTIVTTDPHSLNALRNEYPGLADRTPVVHVTELLADLLASGRLPVRRPISRRVTYHDPCYLARYNRVIDEPRAALRAIGAQLAEMPRHGTRTHCCGAGGGAIWMDQKVKERPSENRIREALTLDGVSDFVVACPKDVTMFEAAVAATGSQDRLRVFDLAELVDEATRPEEAATPAPPAPA
ncbi:MAG: (Fe-S)-binding protein [Candidatus Limnocylindria bacterium]